MSAHELMCPAWPNPPGSSAWLPAYGYQPNEAQKDDDYFTINEGDAAQQVLYLETIVEETSDDLRSEGCLSDCSDADSVIRVTRSEYRNADSSCSGSERELACPAKRRRHDECSLSRTSSLAQFESLERCCAARSPSPTDSLDSPPAVRAASPRRRHLSAENLSEDSGYCERAPRARAHSDPSARAPTEIERRAARRCSARAELAPAASLPADLHLAAPASDPEPAAATPHRARFRQVFRVADAFTASVADLTVLDYRAPAAPRLAPPARDRTPSTDSTGESEREFAREMEATMQRLDETARRALAQGAHPERALGALTNRRLEEAWGAWDDVLDELRRRRARATPSPPRHARSTPELHAPRPRSPPPPPPAPARSVSFSPVVAEVSWREASCATDESEEGGGEAWGEDEEDEEEGGERRPDGGWAAHAPQHSGGMQEAGARAPRSRIAGFLSRFANFRFSARKSGPDKKSRASRCAVEPQAVQPTPRTTETCVRVPLHAPPPPPRGPARLATAPARGGLLETDVDTARTTVLHARSLLALQPPRDIERVHKSMEYLLDKESARVVQPPENDLQKNSDRVLSEHELRVQRSLQKLNVPDWYKNTCVPREGFLLRKRASDAGARWGGGASGAGAPLGCKTTSLGSLGAAPAAAPGQAAHQLSPATTTFGRWSTSRLNSNQTSPCSSTRSSVRGCSSSPLGSPAARGSLTTRTPYLGWRSQERLTTPRTPHERLAISLLPPPSKASEEIQSSIKEVTSAIVHYVSGLEPASAPDEQPSPRGSQKLYWVESSFVGTKPLESPQTPVVVSQGLPPVHPKPPSSLRLDLHHQHKVAATDWQSSQRSLLNLGLTKPSPGSTTLEDVLDSLLGLPSAPARIPTPQPSPRKVHSPYYHIGKVQKYDQYNSGKTYGAHSTPSEETALSSWRSDASDTPRHDSSSVDALATHDSSSVDALATHDSSSVDALATHDSSSVDALATHDSSSVDALATHDSPGSSTCSTLAPGTDTVDNSNATATRTRRSRSQSHTVRRQSDSTQHSSLDRRQSIERTPDLVNSKAAAANLQESRTSLRSIASINTDNSTEDAVVKCKYSKCQSRATQSEAKRNFKSCHNCNFVYCSRECRRAHWEKHRQVCLHSRASTLCRQILSTAKEDANTLHHISALAYQGYLSRGRGIVKVFFSSPEAAEKFTKLGFQHLGDPLFVKWPDLQPNEMGSELYSELVKLCKSYNPESKLILYVAVCILSEVPTDGAVKWERQLVSRCAKLRLSKTISSQVQKNQQSSHAGRSEDVNPLETLILLSQPCEGTTSVVRDHRELCFVNVQKHLQERGVNLKKHFPEVYKKLSWYAEGSHERFAPVTIYPRDAVSGQSFICVIMLNAGWRAVEALREHTGAVRYVDVAVDADAHKVSTPM